MPVHIDLFRDIVDQIINPQRVGQAGLNHRDVVQRNMERVRQHRMNHRHLLNRLRRRREREARDSNLLTILGSEASNSDSALSRKHDRPLHCASDAAKPKVEGAEALVGRSDGEGRSSSSELNVSSCDELIRRRVSCQPADADWNCSANVVGDVPCLVVETEIGFLDRYGQYTSFYVVVLEKG